MALFYGKLHRKIIQDEMKQNSFLTKKESCFFVLESRIFEVDVEVVKYGSFKLHNAKSLCSLWGKRAEG